MSDNSSCPEEDTTVYNISLGFISSVPEWEALLTIVTLTLIIVLTIVGNILVILSVFTHKPLRIVQNFFIVSLAVADLTVAILVLPLNVAYSILGRWLFGMHVCKMWLTSDVMCCTASILNLCAIALDRFWAITDPINYAQKRTLKRVLLLICGVWLLSLLISSPPLIGWNDWPTPEEFEQQSICRLTERAGYVVYSSLGSFFIPLLIMTIVYAEIFIATRRRLRERAQASKIGAMVNRNQTTMGNNGQGRLEGQNNQDRESVSSETNHNDSEADKKHKKKRNKGGPEESDRTSLKPMLVHEDSITDNVEEGSSGSQRRSAENAAASSATSDKKDDGKMLGRKVVKVDPKKPTVVYQFIEEKQRISLSKERRAARTLGIIMGVFVVCWLPFFLMYVIKPFCASCCPSAKLINFITWLGYINSALNPIIYTIFNLDFRRAFKKLLRIK